MAEKLPDHVYDVVILGGGPGGFTAGIYAARAGLKALLLEGETSVSQITATDLIENYPGIPDGIGGFELVERFKTQALKFGLETTRGEAKSLLRISLDNVPAWEVVTGNKTYAALAVIAATGTNWRRLGVPGEEAHIGKGVSFCATCDGPFYRNREVVVVGGGDTALQEALFLTHFASRVTLIHRRSRLRAAAILQERARKNEKIRFLWDSVVKEIRGKEFVEAVLVENLSSKEVSQVSAEGVFIFVGLTPNTAPFSRVVNLDENGYIVTDQEMKTSETGIFAAGDCTRKLLRQVVTACGDGATAAFSAQLYVEALKGRSYLAFSDETRIK